MSGTDVREIVIKALDRAAGLLTEPGTARLVMTGGDLDLAGLELDSLTNLELIMEIEDIFGIELDAEIVAAQQTLNALVAHIGSHLEQDAV